MASSFLLFVVVLTVLILQTHQLGYCNKANMESCCPDGSAPFMAPNYNVIGTCKILEGSDGLEGYVSKAYVSGQKTLVLIPDAFGWNSGRLRNVADYFAAEGYYTVVPKIMTPCAEGAMDGDGMPGDFAEKGVDMKAFFATLPYTTVIKPRIDKVMAHLRSLGVSKVALVGFCWGGWVVSHMLSESDYAEVTCGASPHPSIQVEGWVHGTSNEELVGRIKKPFMLLPAGNDGDMYRPGGSLWEALVASSPQSEVVDEFKEMTHGWSVRGDTADEKINQGVQLCLRHLLTFFNKYN